MLDMEVNKKLFYHSVYMAGLNCFLLLTACWDQNDTQRLAPFLVRNVIEKSESPPAHIDPWTGPVFHRKKLHTAK